MVLYDVPAPAKINLFLHVVGRRDDGYHLLQTVFRFVDLCDSLDFAVRADGRIVCENDLQGLPAQDDLVVRAAQLLQQVTGTRQGAQIACRKVIPAGGGLGGGSSDAATTLIALNRLWNTGLSRQALMRLGARLGADVPVFVFGQTAFAEGVGDLLTAVEAPNRAYVIVRPGQAVATAKIFSAPELTRDTDCVKISVFADWQKQARPEQAAGAQHAAVATEKSVFGSGVPEVGGCPGQIAPFGRNDLESVAVSSHSIVAQASSMLAQLGCKARMSGSGSCFFVEFATLAQAGVCQQKIAATMAAVDEARKAVIEASWVCQALPEHPLRHWTSS